MSEAKKDFYLLVKWGSGDDVGRTFPLGERTVLIGCPSARSTPDIPIHDRYVSRRHAEIIYHQKQFWLRDVGSLNGTEIDGQCIEPNKLYLLHDKSIIGLAIVLGKARVVLQFREEGTIPKEDIGDVNWLRVDEDTREVWVNGKLIPLSKKEYDLIKFLYRRAGKVCDRDKIVYEVWPEVKDPGAVSDAAIAALIHRLRDKIELDFSNPKHIITIKDVGYKLV